MQINVKAHSSVTRFFYSASAAALLVVGLAACGTSVSSVPATPTMADFSAAGVLMDEATSKAKFANGELGAEPSKALVPVVFDANGNLLSAIPVEGEYQARYTDLQTFNAVQAKFSPDEVQVNQAQVAEGIAADSLTDEVTVSSASSALYFFNPYHSRQTDENTAPAQTANTTAAEEVSTQSVSFSRECAEWLFFMALNCHIGERSVSRVSTATVSIRNLLSHLPTFNSRPNIQMWVKSGWMWWYYRLNDQAGYSGFWNLPRDTRQVSVWVTGWIGARLGVSVSVR